MRIKLSRRQKERFEKSHANNIISKIPNTFLIYGMPLTGKSVALYNICAKDYQKYHVQDLVINLWTYLHPNKKYRKATEPYVNARNRGRIRAFRLPYDYMKWESAIGKFKASHPSVAHVLIDEAQCIPSAVLLDTLIMVIRDYYPKTEVIMSSLDFDSWHHKFANIKAIRQMVEYSQHLDHRCMINGCHRIATRRLHLINHKPQYNEKHYDNMLSRYGNHNKKYHFDIISTCSKHYRKPDVKRVNWNLV